MLLAYTCPISHKEIKLQGKNVVELIEQIADPRQFKFATTNIPPDYNAEQLGIWMNDKFGWIIEGFDNGDQETNLCCGKGCCN